MQENRVQEFNHTFLTILITLQTNIMSLELENRFLKYAMDVRNFCFQLKHSVINIEYIKQLVRSSGSVGANYIEASDDLGNADEKMKIKISRREAKESVYWLNLILCYADEKLEKERFRLIDEGNQIRRILSAILLKIGAKP